VFDDDTNDASTTTRCCWRCKSRQRMCCHWQSCWLPPIVRHFGGYKIQERHHQCSLCCCERLLLWGCPFPTWQVCNDTDCEGMKHSF
jgi:hypothetical protein